MSSPEQEKWTAHLSDKNKVRIVPHDPTAENKFQLLKAKIQNAIESNLSVEHRGATSLGISGQDEIDVYIPIAASEFNLLIEPLKKLFGEPRSLYPLERARFVTQEAGKHVDIFLMNEECDGWKNCVLFESHLRSHPEDLESYRKLKEEGEGLSVREYYRRKIEFINSILKKAES